MVLESCQPGLIPFPLSHVLYPQVWSQISNWHNDYGGQVEMVWGGQLKMTPLQGTFHRDKLVTVTDETTTHCKVPCMATHSPQGSHPPLSRLTGGGRISGDSGPLLYHNRWCCEPNLLHTCPS